MSKSARSVVANISEGEDRCAMADFALGLFRASFVGNRKSDLGSFTVYGCNGTENDRYDAEDEDDDSFKNISICFRENKCHMELIRAINAIRIAGSPTTKVDSVDLDLRPSSDGSGDFLEAIVVALERLVKRTGNLKFSRQIFLLSSLGSDFDDDDDTKNWIAKCLVHHNITLHVVKAPRSDAAESSVSSSLSALRDITKLSSGKNCILYNGYDDPRLFPYFLKSIRPTSIASGDLSFANSASIGVTVFALTRKARPPTFQKRFNEPPYPAVSAIREYFVEADSDDSKIKLDLIDPNDRVNAYRCGEFYVSFDKQEEMKVKWRSTPSFIFLGFVPTKSVPRKDISGELDALIPELGNREATDALRALWLAMKKKEVSIVARTVYKDDKPAELRLITPYGSNSEHITFSMVRLPFEGDVARLVFSPLVGERTPKSHTPSNQELQTMEDLIDTMDLDQLEMLGGYPLYDPQNNLNPCHLQLESHLQQKAVKLALPKVSGEGTKMNSFTQKYASTGSKLLKPTESLIKTIKSSEKNILNRFKSTYVNLKQSARMKRKREE
eukprot:g966.t1